MRLREALTLGLYVEHFRKPEISASNPLRFGAEIWKSLLTVQILSKDLWSQDPYVMCQFFQNLSSPKLTQVRHGEKSLAMEIKTILDTRSERDKREIQRYL